MMAQQRLAFNVAVTTPLETVAVIPVGVQEDTVSAMVTFTFEFVLIRGGLNVIVP